MRNELIIGKIVGIAALLLISLWGFSASAATCDPSAGYFCNPLNLGGEGTDTIADFIIIAVKVLLSLVGTFALIFLILGGTRYVVAVGDNDAMQAAKATVTSALAGLVLSLMAYGLVEALEEILRLQD